ncbi:hypothetical protein ABL78_2802 [Leptomonas seymouri]|uniref:MORN repeat-containing protein n=1 Tax=Leptomonas seymouri TaxID=5684 RepID=A0A0N1I749_LEPSE|nr:hypothetical protein ABL78_2802 [Leptomonas seymouri]|eukprot:KPI88115.1 hypothetical protein ABL78_2802 [Leptomonas seymouri]
MPATKKEVKPEEPLLVDEEGSYVHEAEQAKYKGGIRRYTLAGSAEGGGGGAQANPRSNSPASNTKGAAASLGSPPSTSSGAAGRGGGSARVGSSSPSPGNQAAAPGSRNGGRNPSDGSPLFRHGRGTYTCPSFTYEGDWEEDEMHGSGQLTFTESGSTYKGAFARGCFSGHGTYRWRDGAVYCGQWRANRMHGEGVYTDAQGHIWKGKYYNGTGPGLVRLYPTLERVKGVAQAGATTAAACASGCDGGSNACGAPA